MTTRSLAFEPLLPPVIWTVLALAAALALVAYGFSLARRLSPVRRVAVLALMTTGGACVLLILLNPHWVEVIPPPPGKPALSILVDASSSMNAPDTESGRTRFQSAAADASELAERMDQLFDVEVKTFDDASQPTSAAALKGLVPKGRSTDVTAALLGSLRHDHPRGQGIVLLSDGIDHGDGGVSSVLDAARLARSVGAPIHVKCYGASAAVQDVMLEVLEPQQLTFVGQKILLPVAIRHSGMSGKSLDIRLTHGGKEIAKQTGVLPRTGALQVSFEAAQDKPGLYHYLVQAKPLPHEASAANNIGAAVLRVVNEPVKALLLEGKPYWDGKFFVRTLASDPAIDLDTLVRITPERFMLRRLLRNRKSGKEDAAPGTGRVEEWKVIERGDWLSDPSRLKEYQIVVLGRDSDVFLNDDVVGRLRDWIAHDGGSLVCYRGAPMTQLSARFERLMPVEWRPDREQRFHVRQTDRGRALRWIPGDDPSSGSDGLMRMPALAANTSALTPKPLAVVLAAAGAGPNGDTPVISYQPYGVGKTVVVDGAGMWRWAFLPPQHKQEEHLYGSLWQGLLRWLVSSVGLSPGQKLALRPEKISFRPDESTSALLLVREGAIAGPMPPVRLTSANLSQSRTFSPTPLAQEPGSYRVHFGKLPEGFYEARVEGFPDESAGHAVFEVREYEREQLDLQSRPELLSRIAEISAGAVLSDRPNGDVAVRLREQLDRQRPQRVKRTSAWDRQWVMALVFGLWSAAWALRRSSGLV